MGLGGFEPPTSPLSGVRSNQLSYKPGRTGQDSKGGGWGKGIGSFREGADGGVERWGDERASSRSARAPIANLCQQVIYADVAVSVGVAVTGATELAEHFKNIVYVDHAVTITVTVADFAGEAIDVGRA